MPEMLLDAVAKGYLAELERADRLGLKHGPTNGVIAYDGSISAHWLSRPHQLSLLVSADGEAIWIYFHSMPESQKLVSDDDLRIAISVLSNGCGS